MNISLLTALGKYGALGAIAIMLAWGYMERLPEIQTGIQSVQGKLDSIEEQHEIIGERFGEWNTAQIKANDAMLRTMQVLCINSSETKEERTNCLK